ncbi:MAG: hypothetical protein JW727_04635 [Candidatus Aenigmarchaeota archaeon]|nr:hypothetical protein [Candidatus Aenigmarchaeota archaeon]
MGVKYGEMLARQKNSNVLVFSIGNGGEAHGPALFHDTDSFFAMTAATDAARRTGAIYAGHIPFTTDGVGDIAKSWAPAYLPLEKFYALSLKFVKSVVEENARILQKGSLFGGEGLRIVIVVGHGGIPGDFGGIIQKKIGIETACVFPGEEFGMHAGDEEHSLLKYLGHFKEGGLREIHKFAKEKGPEEALRRWPPLLGLSGFWFLEDSERKYGKDFWVLGRYAKESRILDFLAEGKIHVDSRRGREIYEGFMAEVVKAIEG